MEKKEEQKQPAYRTPRLQLLRQIVMLLITIGIALLSTFISSITTKINETLKDLQSNVKIDIRN